MPEAALGPFRKCVVEYSIMPNKNSMEEKQQEKGGRLVLVVVYPLSVVLLLSSVRSATLRPDLLPMLHPSRLYYVKQIHYSKGDRKSVV